MISSEPWYVYSGLDDNIQRGQARVLRDPSDTQGRDDLLGAYARTGNPRGFLDFLIEKRVVNWPWHTWMSAMYQTGLAKGEVQKMLPKAIHDVDEVLAYTASHKTLRHMTVTQLRNPRDYEPYDSALIRLYDEYGRPPEDDGGSHDDMIFEQEGIQAIDFGHILDTLLATGEAILQAAPRLQSGTFTFKDWRDLWSFEDAVQHEFPHLKRYVEQRRHRPNYFDRAMYDRLLGYVRDLRGVWVGLKASSVGYNVSGEVSADLWGTLSEATDMLERMVREISGGHGSLVDEEEVDRIQEALGVLKPRVEDALERGRSTP